MSQDQSGSVDADVRGNDQCKWVTNVNMCRLLENKSPINSKGEQYRQKFDKKGLEWKRTIQTMALMGV